MNIRYRLEQWLLNLADYQYLLEKILKHAFSHLPYIHWIMIGRVEEDVFLKNLWHFIWNREQTNNTYDLSNFGTGPEYSKILND